MKIYVTRPIEGLKDLKAQFPHLEITLPANSNISNSTLKSEDLTKYDALITMLSDRIDNEFLKKNSHLKVIANYAVGLNNVDLTAAKEHQIQVGHTPDILTHSTAELAIGMMLSLARGLKSGQQNIINGQWTKWEPIKFNALDLRQKKLAIIGLGRIGQETARMAHKLWAMKIFALNRPSYKDLKLDYPVQFVDEDELFNNCDVLSLHCPLNKDTKDLINHSFLNRFDNPFIFINTSRGECHNESALLQGLDSGKLLAVGLDVTNPEPMNIDNPLLYKDNVIVTPHIGSATKRCRTEMTKMCLENIEAARMNKEIPYNAF